MSELYRICCWDGIGEMDDTHGSFNTLNEAYSYALFMLVQLFLSDGPECSCPEYGFQIYKGTEMIMPVVMGVDINHSL